MRAKKWATRSTNVAEASAKELRESRERVRRKLRNIFVTAKEDDPAALFKRQIEETSDLFEGIYVENNLIAPPYSFDNLYTIYEESDVLQSCVEAMQMNVDGFGYKLSFLGDDVKESGTPEAVRQRIRAENFFDQVNEKESFLKVRKQLREDLEVLGSGGSEVVRNRRGEVSMMYYIPFKLVRMAALKPKDRVSVDYTIMRDGKPVTIKVKRYFRKFAQVSVTGRSLRWFKELGDPRILDAVTGEYKETRRQCKLVASELMHFKLPFSNLIYGLPRWVGAILEVMGRRSASFVNYDLFDSQGIPPLAVLVSGGVLTDDSVAELETLLRSMRGAANWNRIALLESNVESLGLEDKGSAKIELKNLTEYRKEDLMFGSYMKATGENTRHRFRLPPLYIGAAESFTHATARAAQTVAEEQVFVPERSDFDEMINIQLLRRELGVTLWKYSSKGPRIVGAQDLSKGVETFSKAGAFTVNHAIERANEAFGLEMSKFDAEWANFPLILVLELLKNGRLKGLEDIAEEAAPPKQLAAPAKQLLLPEVTKKMVDSDVFSDHERELYKMLVTIQSLIEAANSCATETEL